MIHHIQSDIASLWKLLSTPGMLTTAKTATAISLPWDITFKLRGIESTNQRQDSILGAWSIFGDHPQDDIEFDLR